MTGAARARKIKKCWVQCNFAVSALQLRETAIKVLALSYFPSYRRDIIVTGGWYGGSRLNHTDIYNTATQEWREGPSLPQPVYGMSYVQYEDSFLLVGGRTAHQEFLDTVYQYSQTPETWILRPEKISSPRELFGAVVAGPPVADCNWCNKCRDFHTHYKTSFAHETFACITVCECERNSTRSDDRSGGSDGWVRRQGYQCSQVSVQTVMWCICT